MTWASRRSRSPSMSNTMILRQPRQPLAHLEHLVELLVVLDEHEARARVRAADTRPGPGRRSGRCRWRPRLRRARRGRRTATRGWCWTGSRPLRPARSRARRAPFRPRARSRPSSSQVVLCQMPRSFWRRPPAGRARRRSARTSARRWRSFRQTGVIDPAAAWSRTCEQQPAAECGPLPTGERATASPGCRRSGPCTPRKVCPRAASDTPRSGRRRA